jgi:hypothetical protein
LLAVPPLAGLYLLLGFGIFFVGAAWYALLIVAAGPENLFGLVVYLTFLSTVILFAYLLHGPLRARAFGAIERVIPGGEAWTRGLLKWGVLHAHQGVLLLAFAVVLVVNLELVAGTPFAGRLLAEQTQTRPGLWVDHVWQPRLREPINAAILTFLALDAYVSTHRPGWLVGERRGEGTGPDVSRP